jgi:hypothetical protein
MEAKIREIEAGRTAAPVVAASAGGGGESSARRIAEELKGVPGASVSSRALGHRRDHRFVRLGCGPPQEQPGRPFAPRGRDGGRPPPRAREITGHTDSVPIQRSKWADNNALSQARAEMVAKTLAAGGAPRERLTVKGVGSADPMVSPEKTASDRAKNRRVEVQFSFAK